MLQKLTLNLWIQIIPRICGPLERQSEIPLSLWKADTELTENIHCLPSMRIIILIDNAFQVKKNDAASSACFICGT